MVEDLYTRMVRIRLFEEALLGLYGKGHLRGTVHTCIGQEACAVGVVGALDPTRDTVCSNHRGHGHFLAFDGDPKGLLDEILGRPTGVCRGVGGSQHLHIRNFYSNGILGGMAPVATGIAFASKRDGNRGVSVLFAGDGAMSEGAIYESLNIAKLWCLPLLLVVEDNHIAQSTPSSMEHGIPVASLPQALGLETETADGTDVLAVRAAAERTISRIRLDSNPRCLVLDTCRIGPHSKGDDTRSPEEIQRCRSNDPLTRAARGLSDGIAAGIERSCREEMEALLERTLGT